LGSLKNIRIFDPSDPTKILIENNDTSDVSYPVVNTALDFNATNKSYKNYRIKSIAFVSNSKAYIVKTDKNSPLKELRNSNANALSKPSYQKVSYLGSTWYLTAHDDDKNATVLITPDMGENDEPLIIGNKKFLTVTFPSYGKPVNGYLFYDNDKNEVQKCSLDLECLKLDLDVGSRDFEGDLAGTPYALFLKDNVLYRVNKTDGEVKKIELDGKKILSGHGTTDIQGGSFYFVGEDRNLYRVNAINGTITKISPEADERIERIRGFTDDYVIYGSDTLLMAAKKDGTSKKPILLAETTLTKGYKYVKDYGINDSYLFVTYRIDTKTNDTEYKACIFKNGKIECKDNSFWAGATAKREGIRDFESTYTFTPYAYIRVDDTDDFGGGTLKAIDPNHPLSEGITLGKIPKYNFQTFITNSRYREETIDSDGGVVFYAKNDETYHVDAFYFNLLKENSLIQLTDTDPFPDVNHGRDHCHGRVCMICHNLAGGKIYKDKKGTKSAYGYRVKLQFEDGKEILADVAKGAGENFSIPHFKKRFSKTSPIRKRHLAKLYGKRRFFDGSNDRPFHSRKIRNDNIIKRYGRNFKNFLIILYLRYLFYIYRFRKRKRFWSDKRKNSP